MKIERILIKNYKSIKNLDLQLSPKTNIFIGENSVGKSNIFSAIEWLLGPTYPSLNSISKEDYYKGDMTQKMRIKITFNDGNYLELAEEWEDQYGNIKTGLNLSRRYVTDDMRKKYISAFIGVDRKITDNPANNRWSLLGRLLRDINERFNEETITINGEVTPKRDVFIDRMMNIRDEILFSVNDSDGKNIMDEFICVLRTETAKQLNREESEFNVDINMYDPWNFYRTLQLLVKEEEMGMTFRASELGMGVQASITIAILKAYSQLKLKNETPIFIDEPELFLHPQGRRNFFKIIHQLCESGTQVFLTTHSSEFISLDRFNEIYVVRKNGQKGTYIRSAEPERFIEDLKIRTGINSSAEDLMFIYKNAYENTGDSQKASEAMFARKIILVEGESEVLILPYFFDLIGYDYIAEGVSIVRCGGKSEIDRFYRLYNEFGIPTYIIFDGDYQNIEGQDKQSTIKKNKGILSLFGNSNDFPDGTVNDNYLGFKYRLEENLNLEGEIGKEIKALRLYQRVKEKVLSHDDVPKWVEELIVKLNLFPNEAESVLIKKITSL